MRPRFRSVLALSSSPKVMLPSELTNAAVCRSVERERERDGAGALSSSVSVTRCRAWPEGAVDLRQRVARAAAREPQAGAAHVVRVQRQDQIAGVLDDGDVADVFRDRRGRDDGGLRFAEARRLDAGPDLLVAPRSSAQR
jgi:hypothetical protein